MTYRPHPDDRIPNEQFMDLDALPLLPPEQRPKRPLYYDWIEIKRKVHEESGNVCHYCGTDTSAYAVCDHKIPLSRGGTNDRENLVTSCAPCNSTKGLLTPDEFARKAGGAE